MKLETSKLSDFGNDMDKLLTSMEGICWKRGSMCGVVFNCFL